jgi:hypothetical protein
MKKIRKKIDGKKRSLKESHFFYRSRNKSEKCKLKERIYEKGEKKVCWELGGREVACGRDRVFIFRPREKLLNPGQVLPTSQLSFPSTIFAISQRVKFTIFNFIFSLYFLITFACVGDFSGIETWRN